MGHRGCHADNLGPPSTPSANLPRPRRATTTTKARYDADGGRRRSPHYISSSFRIFGACSREAFFAEPANPLFLEGFLNSLNPRGEFFEFFESPTRANPVRECLFLKKTPLYNRIPTLIAPPLPIFPGVTFSISSFLSIL